METPATVDPTRARFVKSYAMRRAYTEEVQHPPAVPGVQGAIDRLHAQGVRFVLRLAVQPPTPAQYV